jgi:uncharacterized membrane protein
VDGFSDAVFAFAATLLVADLKVPVGLQAPGAAGLWYALWANWPSYLAFLLSFFTVVIFWGNHHQAFKHIRYTDANLIVLNGLLLMVIAFVPHPTAVLADYLLDPGRATAAAVLYASTLCAAALGVNLIWWYVVRHPDLLEERAEAHAIDFHRRHYQLSLILRAISVVLAFVYVPLCLVFLLLISLYYLVPRG